MAKLFVLKYGSSQICQICMLKICFKPEKNYCSLLLVPIQIFSEIVSDMFWKLCCLVLIFCCLRPALTKASSSIHSYKEARWCTMHTNHKAKSEGQEIIKFETIFCHYSKCLVHRCLIDSFQSTREKSKLRTSYVLDIWWVKDISKGSGTKKACAHAQ